MDPTWVRVAPNGTSLGLFKIGFLFILAHRAKMNRKLILKSPIIVPFGVKQAQLEVISDMGDIGDSPRQDFQPHRQSSVEQYS